LRIRLSRSVVRAPPSVVRCRSLEQQPSFALDQRPHPFGDEAQQPRQLDLDAHALLLDVDAAGRGLSQHADAEIEMVARPGLVDDREFVAERLARPREPGSQTAQRLLFSELMWDLDDERLGHGKGQGSEVGSRKLKVGPHRSVIRKPHCLFLTL